MTVSEFPAPPIDLPDGDMHRRQIAISVNQMLTGKSNNVIDLTLTASAASTTITDARIGINTALLFMPTTANASAEIGAGTIYVSQSNRVNGSVAVTHANNSQTDRTFKVILVG
tara:strand:- start:2693 stop:3034 length:342 start_codon:yes stop_codon:yes gene_type:complete